MFVKEDKLDNIPVFMVDIFKMGSWNHIAHSEW